MKNVTEFLSVWARETPDAPAILTGDGTLSFCELERAVRWTAASFRKAGLAPGDIVGVHLADSVRHVVSSLALAQIGVGHCVFHDTDPLAHRRELARRMDVVGTIADANSGEATGAPLIEPPPERLAEIKGLSATGTEIARGHDLPFLLMPTSGTTGIPKLLLLTHEIFRQRMNTYSYNLPTGAGMKALSLTNVAFGGARQRALAQVLAGGCLTIMDRVNGMEALVEFILQHEINFVAGVPSHMLVLLEYARERRVLLPCVEAFQLSTTLVAEPLRAQICEHLTPNLCVRYGINEFGTVSCAAPADIASGPPGTVGTPAPGVRLDVIGDHCNALPRGEIGQLRVKSSGMIDGYLNDPVASARSFRDGWFYTGDLVEFTGDGVLIHHGRADDVMIYDGINIHPAEIENALLRHPTVSEAAAFSIHSEPHGDIPVVAVVIKSQVSVDELYSHCWSWLGPRSPQGVMIVPKLPRNAAGKVTKHELPKMFRDHQQQKS